ncbi:hypothetical protein C6558_38840, partial [Ensifer sp. NM-2]
FLDGGAFIVQSGENFLLVLRCHCAKIGVHFRNKSWYMSCGPFIELVSKISNQGMDLIIGVVETLQKIFPQCLDFFFGFVAQRSQCLPAQLLMGIGSCPGCQVREFLDGGAFIVQSGENFLLVLRCHCAKIGIQFRDKGWYMSSGPFIELVSKISNQGMDLIIGVVETHQRLFRQCLDFCFGVDAHRSQCLSAQLLMGIGSCPGCQVREFLDGGAFIVQSGENFLLVLRCHCA